MRKLIVSNFVTIDGLFDGPSHNIGPLFEHFHPDYHGEQSYDHFNAELLAGADYLLLSRRSFLGNKDYWTGVPADPASTPIRRKFSSLISATPKLVISDRLEPHDLAPWANTEIIPRHRAYSRIAELKQQDGRPILVIMSHLLWQDLLAHGLVDEIAADGLPARRWCWRAAVRVPPSGAAEACSDADVGGFRERTARLRSRCEGRRAKLRPR